MGEYADDKRTATTKTSTTSDAVTQRRKPLPKGSDGSKPTARRPGEKPKPKRTGAIFDAVMRDRTRTNSVDPLLYPAERELMFPAMTVGSTVTRTIGLINDDDRSLVVDAISPARTDPFDDFKVLQPRSVEVAAGQQTNVEISFTPSKLGTARQTFQITTSEGPVGPEGDFDVVGGAMEWKTETTLERVERQDQLVGAIEAGRAVDPLHAERALARTAVEGWAKRATEINQAAADWSRDNWLEFLSFTGGAYTLYPSNRTLKVVKAVIADWIDLTWEIEVPEGKFLTGVAAKLGAKHIQEAMFDFFFDKLAGEERPPADEQAASAAKSVGKAALGKSREVDAYRDRGSSAIDEARSGAELKIQSARSAGELETWRSWGAQRTSTKPKLADRSLRDQLLKEWMLQRAATPDSANRDTNPVAWEEVKKRMTDGGIATLDRQDLFLYQCQYEWQRLGLADADDAVERLDGRRQRIDGDARAWGNDEKAASRMVATFLGAADQAPSTFHKSRNADQTARALGEGITGYELVPPETLKGDFLLNCNVSLGSSGEAVFVKFFRYSILVGDVHQEVIHYPRGGRP
jgi:Abnormal spindle-like microcephaly-assoc'd, ASPM-SPD-2-Hydin